MNTQREEKNGRLWQAGHVACQCQSPLVSDLSHRLSRRTFLAGLAGASAAALFGFVGGGQADVPTESILFINARLFDWRANGLQQGKNVLVAGHVIRSLPPAGERVENAQIIDCGGRVIMLGLIGTHWHAILAGLTQVVAMTTDLPYVHLTAAREAERTLLRGFTSVRDVGRPAFALQRALDENIVAGPRIFPSGAMVSQTSAHGGAYSPFSWTKMPTSSTIRGSRLISVRWPRGRRAPTKCRKIQGADRLGNGHPVQPGTDGDSRDEAHHERWAHLQESHTELALIEAGGKAIDQGDVLEDLDFAAFVNFWARKDRYVFSVDVMYVDLSENEMINFVPGLGATGDIGGFGAGSRFTWQVLATLNYSFTNHLSVSGGYKILSTDYSSDGHVFDTTLSGPALGVTYRF